jgi:hypothetical protein
MTPVPAAHQCGIRQPDSALPAAHAGLGAGDGHHACLRVGACATAVAAHLRGLTGRQVMLEVDGGVLEVDWRDDGVWLTGPGGAGFDGVLSADYVAACDERAPSLPRSAAA